MDGSISNTAHQLLNYKGRLLRHYGAGAGSVLECDSDGAGTFTPFEVALTGTTHTNTIVDGLASTSLLFVGMTVTGTGIANNTTISSITSNTAIVISPAATGSATVSLTFIYRIREAATGLRIKGIESNGNFYFTTSEGIKKISAASSTTLAASTITNAGGIKALDLKATINTGAGFLSPSSVVAYRSCWGIKDANNNLILGSPSERVVVNNSLPFPGSDTLSRTVDLRLTIPKGVTTSYFYQIYRTLVLSNVNSFQFTGDTHVVNPTTIDNIADTSSLEAGMSITGTNIPAATTISSISSATSIVISAAATGATAGVTFTVSQTLDQDPGDEEALVYENNPTSADLTNGFVTLTDITPESFRGANLYTNADSGEGIAQANDVPPLAKDITSFKGYTFFASTQTRQRLNLSFLSLVNLVSNTSTLTITDGTTSNTYTFRNAGAGGEDIANKKVLISALATPGQQVDETARSLIRVINNQSNEIVNGFYLSTVDSVPGLILLEARALNQAAFYLTVNNAATTGVEFSPNIPVDGTTPPTNTVLSTNETSPNRIYYSKFQQPEAVPILNFLDVGPKDKEIIRILALRDSLFVLKEEGIYRLSGPAAPFQVYPFDFSTNIKSADSAVVLNNLIYMMSNQGVNTVSDTGVAIISRPIEDKLISLFIPSYTNFAAATFGVSYESDRAYYLFTVTNPSDTLATQCFRFNTFTNTWTILNLAKRSGIVNVFDDVLYLGPTDTNFLEQERKSYTRTDFADREISVTLAANSINGTTITFPSLTNISAGDVIVQTQYVTLSQFNRLLSKLDRDTHLSPHSYTANLTASAGLNLSAKLDSLISQIAADTKRQTFAGFTAAATYTALSPVATSFSGLQTAFNSLIALLNADVGVGFKNYSNSANTVDFELPILSVDTIHNTITTNYTYPLIAGPTTVYNHITTDLQFVPQSLGDVSMTKQASEATYIFEDSNFTSATVSYSSDLSADFESITINGAGNGTYGNSVYGQGIYGGNGSGVPFRTYVPRNKQHLRYLNCRFGHSIAREIFSLYGLSVSYRVISSRGYR